MPKISWLWCLHSLLRNLNLLGVFCCSTTLYWFLTSGGRTTHHERSVTKTSFFTRPQKFANICKPIKLKWVTDSLGWPRKIRNVRIVLFSIAPLTAAANFCSCSAFWGQPTNQPSSQLGWVGATTGTLAAFRFCIRDHGYITWDWKKIKHRSWSFSTLMPKKCWDAILVLAQNGRNFKIKYILT